MEGEAMPDFADPVAPISVAPVTIAPTNAAFVPAPAPITMATIDTSAPIYQAPVAISSAPAPVFQPSSSGSPSFAYPMSGAGDPLGVFDSGGTESGGGGGYSAPTANQAAPTMTSLMGVGMSMDYLYAGLGGIPSAAAGVATTLGIAGVAGLNQMNPAAGSQFLNQADGMLTPNIYPGLFDNSSGGGQ